MTPSVFSTEPTVVPVLGPLQSIQEEWETIYAESSVQSPFLSFEYLCLWYNCFATEKSIRVLRVESQGETVGFLPLVLTKVAGRRILSSITNHHCFHCPPLIRKDREKQFSDRLYPLFKASQSSWDILRLGPFFSFHRGSEIVSEAALSRSAFRAGRAEQPDFVIDLRGTFDDYYHQVISSKLRTNLKSRHKRLQDAGAGTFRHYQKDEAAVHFGEFIQLEGSGWKGRAGTSILSLPENYQRYYHSLVNLLAKRNDLHLFFLDLDNQPIAGTFGYTDGEVFHWFKIGYREEYREMAPLNLLLLDNIKFFMENRRDIRWFHLFPGDFGFKHRWINEDTTMVEAVLFSSSLRGRSSHAAYRVRKCLKNIPWLHKMVRHLRPGE